MRDPHRNLVARQGDPLKRGPGYTQMLVWPGTTFTYGDLASFQEMLQEAFGVSMPARVVGTVETRPTPGEPGTGGRVDLCFVLHDDDVAKLVLTRMQFGIKWLEDVHSNSAWLYPSWFWDKYPPQW